MRILIESEDETASVEIREAGAHVGDAGADEAAAAVWDAQTVPDGQTHNAGAAPAELRVEPLASENGDSELINIGGFGER